MTDQPHDHAGQEPTDQPPGAPLWTLEEAATALEITVNAVRQRLKRGTIAGVKTNNGWLVDLTATNQQPTIDQPFTDTTNRPTNHATTPIDQHPTIDLAPLVTHIATLENQVQRLTEAAAIWQVRARQAEDKLLELAAGPVATDTQPDPAPDTPGSPLSHATGPARRRSWWRRLWES